MQLIQIDTAIAADKNTRPELDTNVFIERVDQMFEIDKSKKLSNDAFVKNYIFKEQSPIIEDVEQVSEDNKSETEGKSAHKDLFKLYSVQNYCDICTHLDQTI